MTILALGVLGCALLVLPGFALRSAFRRPQADAFDELALGLALSMIAMAVLGVLLLGTGAFSASRMALPIGLLGLAGLPRAVRWAVPLVRRPAPYVLAALSIPWWWSAQRPGNPPAGLLQWYYWNLASVLTKVHGVPTYVSEYGSRIRWLPDYLVFDAVSETFHGTARFGNDVQALAAFRIPLAVFGIVAVYGVARLWLRTAPALVGTALVVATQLFGDKFNAYKPESYAIVLGLVAVRLGVVAVRRRNTPLLLLVGVVVGMNLGVHAIAAVVTGMLLAGAVLAELLCDRQTRQWRTVGAFVLAGVVAVGVAAGTGLALQGRALVISDAEQPARTASGGDPTLLFLTRNSGRFGPPKERSIGDELSSNLQEPWKGFDLASVLGVLAGVAVIAGVALGLLARNVGIRKALLALLAFAAMLAIAATYFGLAYDTFVPRHTGLFRFVSYSPLVAALLVAVALEGFALRFEAMSAVGRARVAKLALAGGVVVGAGVLAAVATVDRYRNYQSIPSTTAAFLDRLAERAKPGDALIGNVGTRGTFEFWTGLEDPLEGRQALIEKPGFVTHSTRVIEDAHAFFTGKGAADLADRLGVNWIVVSPTAALGGSASWGTPPPGWTVPGFTEVPGAAGLRVLHRSTVHPGKIYVGPAEDRTVETLGALMIAGAVVAIGWVVFRRRRPGPPSGDTPAPETPDVDAPVRSVAP